MANRGYRGKRFTFGDVILNAVQQQERLKLERDRDKLATDRFNEQMDLAAKQYGLSREQFEASKEHQAEMLRIQREATAEANRRFSEEMAQRNKEFNASYQTVTPEMTKLLPYFKAGDTVPKSLLESLLRTQVAADAQKFQEKELAAYREQRAAAVSRLDEIDALSTPEERLEQAKVFAKEYLSSNTYADQLLADRGVGGRLKQFLGETNREARSFADEDLKSRVAAYEEKIQGQVDSTLGGAPRLAGLSGGATALARGAGSVYSYLANAFGRPDERDPELLKRGDALYEGTKSLYERYFEHGIAPEQIDEYVKQGLVNIKDNVDPDEYQDLGMQLLNSARQR